MWYWYFITFVTEVYNISEEVDKYLQLLIGQIFYLALVYEI